jgi:molybdate transport system substrate-binding protein
MRVLAGRWAGRAGAVLGVAALALAAAAGSGRAQVRDAPVVAAAADLQFALGEVAAKFRADSGREVRLAFGSSGNFARQLMQGAPFEMFLSADEGFVLQLADAGRTLDRGALYAEGRIVLFAPAGSPLKPDADLADLRAALADGRLERFAIANPEHAPYGRAAAQALEGQGLWEAIRPRLVLGENVSQAAQFATTGSAQGGIFAYSLALAPAVGRLGTYVLLPAEWHAPLRQRMVLMRNAGETARAFYAFVRTPAARAVLRRYGFLLPGEGV